MGGAEVQVDNGSGVGIPILAVVDALPNKFVLFDIFVAVVDEFCCCSKVVAMMVVAGDMEDGASGKPRPNETAVVVVVVVVGAAAALEFPWTTFEMSLSDVSEDEEEDDSFRFLMTISFHVKVGSGELG